MPGGSSGGLARALGGPARTVDSRLQEVSPGGHEKETSVGPEPGGRERPQGRQGIVSAVVEAATALFAQRGPAAVSLRQVAGAANVTLSQIHRHVGNKESLIAAVLDADL